MRLQNRAAVGVVLVLAGCLSGPAADDLATPPSSQEVLRLLEAALVDDHDHKDPALHDSFVHGARMVHRMPFLPQGPAHPHEASKVLDGYLYQALRDPPAGVAVYDVADAARPRFVSHYDSGATSNAGFDVSPDGKWMFVATEASTLVNLLNPAAVIDAQARGAQDGAGAVAGQSGLQIVDVSDKADPRFVAAHPDPIGYHKVAVADVAGGLYVFAGAFLTGGRVDILRFEETPQPHLVPVADYQSEEARDPRTGLAASTLLGTDKQEAHTVHDIYVETDPLEGFPMLVVSYWAGGVHLLDVSDPAQPRFLGKWDGFTDVPVGSVMAAHVTAVEGRRIVVAIPELLTYERQGLVWVVDVTDLAAPRLLGTWSIPGEHPITEPLIWSTHNFVVRDGKVYLAHFHAGAYVLDIGTLEAAAAPVLRAAILPRGIDPTDGPWPLMWATAAMDVAVNGRHLYVAGPDLAVFELDDEAAPTPAP